MKIEQTIAFTMIAIVVLVAICFLAGQDKGFKNADEASRADRQRIYCEAHPLDVLCNLVKP